MIVEQDKPKYMVILTSLTYIIYIDVNIPTYAHTVYIKTL